MTPIRTFTKVEMESIVSVLTYLTKEDGDKTDAFIISKFGEDSVKLVKEWAEAALEWERTTEKRIQDAVITIQMENCNDMVIDPDGKYPRCPNAIGTWNCERCGRDVRVPLDAACPAVPVAKRWSFRSELKKK